MEKSTSQVKMATSWKLDRMLCFAVTTALFLLIINECHAQYQPTWESIDSRPLPQWYDDGKIGIATYWGVYSVPGVENEWFWNRWRTSKTNLSVDYMKNNYKPDITYQDLAPKLTAEFFNPDKWMDLFEKAGARYVVITAKHHEGYAMWPSKYSFSWNSVDVGPNRDIVAEFAAAAKKKKSLHFGVYYSLFEWYHPLYMQDVANHYKTDTFVKTHTIPMFQELVQNYEPELLWSDGDWMVDDTYWDTLPFLAWLYNESPVKDTVVINDRWGHNAWCKHGGYWTCKDRYDPGVLQKKKWENVMFIDKNSSSFRKVAPLADYLNMTELLTLLTRTVSCGGNLLIDVGITAEGTVPAILEERLLSLGEWLTVNGEAIYSSKPWAYQNDTDNPDVWYTMKENSQLKTSQTVYAILLKWPASGVVSLGAPVPVFGFTRVEMLGVEGLFPWKMREGGGIDIVVADLSFDKMPSYYAWTFRLNGLNNSNAQQVDGVGKDEKEDDVLKFRPYH